jgi:capsular exopolysaccharide synthesis family protein
VRLQLEQRRETTAAAPPPAPLPAGVVHAAEPLAVHPQVQTVSAEIRKVDAEIQQIRAVAVSPEVAREIIDRRGLPRQRRELEQALLELTGKAPPAGIVPVAGPAPPAPQGIEPLQAQAALLEKNRHELQKQIEELTRELKEMATAAAEIETIQKEIDPIDSANRSVAAELDRLRRDMDAPEPITLIETADVPRVQVERRFPYPALAGVGAFVLTLVGIGVVESRKRRVYTVRDVVQGLEIPVIGTHAYLSTRPEGNGQQPWFARPDDAVDAVRALLLHQSGSGSLARVVLIASSVGGEGATTAAVELAASLARAGRRTLLVDAHLRRPAAHRAFGLPEGPGLSEVLRGEMSGPAAVRAAPLDRLWLLPAGRADLQAIEVLSRDGARGLLEQWKKDYDFIVFDGAPVAAAADALVLLQRADAVILSVLAGVSRLPAVHAAWQRLSALDARLLGAVVHGAGEDISSLS